VAVVDEVADKRGTREVATEYLKFLYSDEGQRIAGRHFYRPSNPEILKEFGDVYNLSAKLITIRDPLFGDWEAAQKKHFADGAIFDKIYSK
jgi:sulfate transport system substrate-binding protein